MADNIITTNITAHADFTSLRAQLAAVTAQLVRLQETTAGTNAKLANQIAVMNKSFATTLTSTGQFSQHFVSLSSDVDKFGKNLDRGRLKLNEYYSAWNGHTRKTSTLIRDLAKQQVMLEQAIVQPIGKNAQGLMQYNVMVAKGLDEVKNKMAIARQEAAIMNKVMLDGSNQLINWGKNTQWAGRQLTVGLTVPLIAFGAAAQKAFREADAELVRLTKVYGGLAATSSADLAQVRKDVTATAKEIASSYGVAYKETIALAADLAATGQQGNELIAATQQTTRLAVLGEVDRQDAMKATLAIQNAFKQSTDELAQSIDFLNAVENQTSTSLADLTEAIPKAGPVIKSLGGDVKDLALYLTAMKEGGVNASEGANAIKSAMASLINPTKVATEQFMGFGIDLKGIVNNNAGNLTATILDLQAALDNLNPLDKSRAIEQLFGKFQFARMSALFENLGKSGSQTLQVMDLMKASVTDLAAISERELKMMTESASGQFKRAWAAVQADLASVGEQFLRISTKVLKVVDAIINFFKELPGPVKTFLNALGGLTAIAGPLIMMAGVMGNFIGYVVKGIFHLRQLAKGGQGFKLLTPEIIAADAAAKGLATSFYSDSEATIVLSNAVNTLAESFVNLEAKANAAKVSVQPAVTTVAGGVIMAGTPSIGRSVDKDHPLVGKPFSRDMSHLIPSGMPQMGTIFGTVPGAKPVNIRVGRNPQAYMDGDLPKIPGLTSIGGASTGIVAAEAAKWHAMTAAISMQSQEELAVLKKEVMATGTVTSSLSDSYQALLPEFTQITQLAAQETAAIVQQVQQGKITVEAARAKIIALNQQVESMLAETTRLTAAGMGRTASLSVVPLTTQPVVDPVTGKSNMKEMFHKGSVKEMADRIARALGGVRTSGAGYNIETTKPKFARGGYVPGTGNTDTYHTTAEAGSFVINKKSTQENKPFIDRLLGGTSYYANRGGQTPVVLTPGEAVIPADIAQNNMPLMYALNGGPGNTSGMGRNGGGATAAERAQAERNVRGASTWAARMEVSENWLEEKQVRHVINDAAVLNELGMSEVESIKTAKRHYDEARRYAYDPKTDKIDDARWAEIRERQAKELDKRLGGRLLRPMPVQVVTSRGVTSGRTVIPAILPSPSLLDTIGKMGFSSPTELLRIREQLFGQSVWDPASRKWIPATHSYASEHDIRIGQYGYRAAGNYGQAIAGNKEINQWTATFSKLTGSHETPFVDRIPGTLTEKQIALDTVGNVLGVGKGPGVAERIMAAPERLKYNFGITKAFMSFLMSKRPGKMSMSKQKLNSGGTVAQRLFPGGTVFLGMPKTIKQVEAQRAARDAMVRADKAVADSRFSRNPVTVYDEKIGGDGKGHSFPVGGIGGVYIRDGEKFFVKPVVDEKRALAESRFNEITNGVGLTAPQQRVVVIKDPTDPLGRRKILALESKYDPRFSDMPDQFDENQYFKQLALSALRGDKDLARGNLGADRVADAGASGVFDTASGVREYSRSMPSFKHQAMMNLLGVKGSGAKRFFAESTAGIPKGMTADQYHQRMLDEIEDMLPRLKQTISRFDLNSEEKKIYNEMIKRMEDARRENYTDLHGIHSSLQIAPQKTLTPAALAKMAAADELKRRQKGHAASLADNDFKTPENGFILGGLIGALTKGKALHRIGAGFGKDSTGGWGVTSLEIGMAEKLFASTGLTKRTQRILYDKLAAELAKEMPYGYTKNAQGHLIKALEPDIMDTVIRSAASSTLSDPLGRKVLSQIDREILRKKFANWESKKDTSITDALKQLIFKLEGREKGGPVNAGQPYIVGEKGPEIFVPRNAGGIVPNGYGIGGQIAMGTAAMAGANFLASKVANETVAMIIQQLGFMLPMMLSPMLGGGSSKGMIGRGLTKVGLGAMTTPLALSNKNPGEITKFGNALVKAESSGTKFGKMVGKIGFGLTRFNVATALVVGGLMFLKNRWDANTESMRLNALGYGMTEEAAKKAGLKFRDLNKALKESVDAAKATREQNQLLYQSMTGSGTPLNITIAEFKKLKKTVKEQFADQIKLIDKTSADDQLGLAERLKTQFIGMGMTSEEATKKIYTMYTLSKNFSTDASLYTVAADGFNEIKTAVEAAAAAIKIYNETVHEGRDGTEQADALTTANAALLNAIEKDQEAALKKRKENKKEPAFISTADKNKLMLETELKTLEKISKEQRYQKTISQETLDELEKTNPTLFEIASLHDTNISLLQKQRLIARGFALDMRGLSAAQVDQVYRFNLGVTQAIESVGRVTFLKANYEKLDNLKKLQEKYTKAMKGQSAAQQISDRDKLAALQKQIDANNKLADARIKALDAAKKEGDIAREIAKAQARYEAALATGNTADAQQASLDMQGLQSDLQYEAQVKAIEDATTLKNAPLLKQIELIQKKQQDVADAAALAAEKFGDLTGQIDKEESAINSLIRAMANYRTAIDLHKEDLSKWKTSPEALGMIAAITAAATAAKVSLKEYPVDPQTGKPGTAAAEGLMSALETALIEKGIVVNGDIIINGKKMDVGLSTPGQIADPKNVAGKITGEGKDRKFFDSAGNPVTEKAYRSMPYESAGSEYIVPIPSIQNKEFATREQAMMMFLQNNNNKATYKAGDLTFYHNGTVRKGKALAGRWFGTLAGDANRVKSYYTGSIGAVRGEGTGTSDSIPAYLSNGEYVLRASAVSQYGVPFLDALNAEKLHMGGKVGHKHGDSNGNFFSKFNPANAFSSIIEGMFGFGVSNQFKTNITPPKSTQSEKDLAALRTLQTITGYTSAFNLKNNTSPEIFGHKSLGVAADLLGIIPILGTAGKLGTAIRANKATSAAKATDSIFSQESIQVGEDAYKAFTIGKDKTRFTFKGAEESRSGRNTEIADSDLSSLTSVDDSLFIVPTTPQGLIEAALKLKPKDKTLINLLNNFKNKNYGPAETELLDFMTASSYVNKENQIASIIDTEGLALVIAHLSGNKAATSALNIKKTILDDIIAKEKSGASASFSSIRHEGPLEPNQVPVIHSTSHALQYDANGNIIVKPAGYYRVGEGQLPRGTGTLEGSDVAVPRSTVHTTLYGSVADHLYSQWSPANTKIISTLDGMIGANGKPYSMNPTDTWWSRSPGESLVFPKGTTAIISPFTDEIAYAKELIKRGVIKDGETPPIVAKDPNTNEILHLSKQTYSSEQLQEIADMMYSQGQKLVVNDGKLMTELRSFGETQLLEMGSPSEYIDRLAIQLAKEKLAIEGGPVHISGHSLSSNWADEHVKAIASDMQVPFLQHQGSSPQYAEFPSGFQTQIRERGGYDYADPVTIDSLRFLALNGHYPTPKVSGKKTKSMFDDEDIWDDDITRGATGGLLSNGRFQTPKMSSFNIPKFDSGINNVPADMLAQLHKNEAVIPANMNPFNPNANNATMGGATFNITNNINGFDGDINQLSNMVTQKTITAISSLNARTTAMSGPTMTVGIK